MTLKRSQDNEDELPQPKRHKREIETEGKGEGGSKLPKKKMARHKRRVLRSKSNRKKKDAKSSARINTLMEERDDDTGSSDCFKTVTQAQ